MAEARRRAEADAKALEVTLREQAKNSDLLAALLQRTAEDLDAKIQKILRTVVIV